MESDTVTLLFLASLLRKVSGIFVVFFSPINNARGRVNFLLTVSKLCVEQNVFGLTHNFCLIS